MLRSFCEQPLEPAAETGRDRFRLMVPAVCHNLAAGSPDAVHRRAGATENPAIDNGVARAPNQRQTICIKADDVGRKARGETACDAECTRATDERGVEHRASGRGRTASGHDIARAILGAANIQAAAVRRPR